MRNFISPIISERKPDFLKREYKDFSRFIDHFYSFLEESGNPLEVLENLYERLEANNEVEGFIDKLLLETGFDIKNTITIPKKELILHLREFYLSRGSEASFKFLFKLLYGCDVSIDYPRKRMLVPSQATYSSRFFVFTTSKNLGTPDFERVMSLASTYDLTLTGISSKTVCSIEGLSIVRSQDTEYLKIQIDSPYKEFQKGEGIEIKSQSSGTKITESFVDTLTIRIDDPGKGYAVGDTVTITNTGTVGNARVRTLKDGSVSDVAIVSGGINYAVGDQILTTARSKGHSFSAVVSSVDNSGNFLAVPMLDGLDLTTGDFAVEVWVYMPVTVGESTLLSCRHPTENRGWELKIDGNRKLVFTLYGSTNYSSRSIRSVSSNVWVHLAATRDGNTLRLFVNGVKSSSDTIADGVTSSEDLRVGISTTGKSPFIGYMDELRITKGFPRYTNNFALPTTDFDVTDDLFSSVNLLLHFNGITFEDASNLSNPITVNGNISISNSVIKFTSTSGYFSGLGAISRVSTYNHGYGYDSIPNLVVHSKQGVGAILEAESDSIGQIESIEILDPFFDSLGNPSVVVTSENGTGAILTAVSSSVFSEKPSWKSFEGALGINSTLLDSYYYQQFSYTAYSPVSRKDYDASVDEWLHPAGFVRFSVLDISFTGSIRDRRVFRYHVINNRKGY